MSIQQRIMSGLAANTFGQAVTIGSQILLTPLFFKYWGAAKYGEWLILSSIPAYLSMADLGIGSAAGNEMTMRAGAGDRVGAQQTFRGAGLVFAGASVLVLLIGLLAAAYSYHSRQPGSSLIAPQEAALVMFGLSLSVLLGFGNGLVFAGFRCSEHNALGISLGNVSRLAEAVVMGALLIAQQSPVVLCFGALSAKLVTLGMQVVILRRLSPWLHHPRAPADKTLVKRLIGPSVGFMAFPLGHALALQGPILVIGAVLGSPAVAMFSAMRTLARLPVQITNIFNNSVWPEMSRAYGSGDLALLRSLHRGSWGLTLSLTLVAGLSLWLLGPWVAHLWLGPTGAYDGHVLMALIAASVISSVWTASYVVMAAINAHTRMGILFVIANAISLGSMYALAQALGWSGIFVPMLLAELVLMAWVLPQVIRTTQDSMAEFLRSAVVDGPRSIMHKITQWVRPQA